MSKKKQRKKIHLFLSQISNTQFFFLLFVCSFVFLFYFMTYLMLSFIIIDLLFQIKTQIIFSFFMVVN